MKLYLQAMARAVFNGLIVWSALLQLTACGHDPAKSSELKGVRDSFYFEFHKSQFSFPEDEHPKISGSTFYYLVMTDAVSLQRRAYAIDCRGRNVADVVNVFGADASNPYPGASSYAEIENEYRISEQPILRCTSLAPTSDNALKNQSIQKVFQLVDDRPEDQKSKNPLPQLFVRFNNVTEDDATSQEQLYSIGCRNILNAFGTEGQKSLTEAVPILASSIASIFLDFASFRPLNCMTNTLDPLLNKPPKKIEDLDPKAGQNLTQNNLQFYRVVDAINPQSTVSYLVGQGSEFKRVLCYTIPDAEIKAALNFPASYVTQDLKSDDSRYLDALGRAEIECVNFQTIGRFENRWTTVRETPAVNYYKKKDARILYRFNCPSAETYFTSRLKLSQDTPLQVTPDLIAYLAANPVSGYQVVQVPCHGVGDTRDPTALQMGEVVSLKLLSAPADKAWFDGNTTSSEVRQVATQNTGSYWLVSPSGEDGYFHLQPLGANPSLNFLACPAEGDTPRLVKSPDESGYQTKWAAYRGDGSSTVRLGCTDASGRVRFLNGGGTSTLLSDEFTAHDAATSWWIQHQTFVEDPTLLVPGNIVSIYSLLTPQNKRWLGGYPEEKYEMGLEASNASAATYFQVEGRKDSRGVSLKSLNYGAGDRYIDCKPEADHLWFELGPMADGIYTGTGFKAYRLSNSTFPIFKLACTQGSGTSPYWMSMSGDFPSLIPGLPANISDMHSILYLQVRPSAPPPPATKPLVQKIARKNITIQNYCGIDFDLAILSFDTAWTTKVLNIKKSGTSQVFPVQNLYSYYLPVGNISIYPNLLPDQNTSLIRSEVYLQYQGNWRRTFEIKHTDSLMVFCGND